MNACVSRTCINRPPSVLLILSCATLLLSAINGYGATNVRAQLTSPANGSVLASSTLPLAWNAGVGVTSYWIYIGTTPGGTQIYSGSQGTILNNTFTVPVGGSKIYVSLWSLIGGVWKSNLYVFTTATGARATLASPDNGSALTDSTLNLVWNAGTGVTSYWIYIGSTVGGKDIASLNGGTGTSKFISGLPTDGGPIYVTLWSLVNGVWLSVDCWFGAAEPLSGSIQSRLTSPANTSTLTSSLMDLTWDAGTSVTRRDLWVGSTPDGYDLYKGPNETGFSRTLTMPCDGRRIYVTLHSLIGGVWNSNAYYFKAHTSAPAQLLSPANDSTLMDNALSLVWDAVEGATSYWIYVGSAEGWTDIASVNAGTSTSRVVTVPTDGRPLYVTLWTLISGKWLKNYYWFTTFDENLGGGPVGTIYSPANGSTLTSSQLRLQFNRSNGGYAVPNQIFVGSTVGGSDLGRSAMGLYEWNGFDWTTTIPTDGRKIYVTFWARINFVWYANHYFYYAANLIPEKATMTSPVDGSVFTSSNVTFNWSPGTATQYWLTAGYAPGSTTLYAGNQGMSLTRTLTNVPLDGGPVYVRLQSLVNGVWLNNDYIYQAALPP